MNGCRILTFTVIAVCTTAATATAQKNKTTCGADVPVIVSVTGTQSATNGMAYVSDGNGPYVHGVGRVEAHFQVGNCTHDLTMNLNRTSRSMFALLTIDGAVTVFGSHFFNFDRVHSVPLTNDTTGAFDRWCAAIADPTKPAPTEKNSDGYYEDNYIACGNDDPLDDPNDGNAPNPYYNFVRRKASLNLDGDERLSFRGTIVNTPAYAREACYVDGPDSDTCSTNFVKVYHRDANTWVIASESPGQAARFAWAGGNKGYQFQGFHTVPLEITITRK